MRPARAEVPARAGLVGNPSDGFGGATLAVTFDDFAARALVSGATAHGADPPSPLIEAALRGFAAHARQAGHEVTSACSVRWESSIPREVGLGGSSALVIAVLRALFAYHGMQIENAELAALALSVETEELGIAAGPQDRVVQCYGGLVFMDFAPRPGAASGRGIYQRLDGALLPRLYLAYLQEAGASSGVVHADLRRRFDAGEAAVVGAMRRLAGLAHEARARLLRRDHAGFANALDSGFDVRREVCELDPRHERMVDVARGAGASATFAGSGGAIVGVCEGAGTWERLQASLAACGCTVIQPHIAAPDLRSRRQ